MDKTIFKYLKDIYAKLDNLDSRLKNLEYAKLDDLDSRLKNLEKVINAIKEIYEI